MANINRQSDTVLKENNNQVKQIKAKSAQNVTSERKAPKLTDKLSDKQRIALTVAVSLFVGVANGLFGGGGGMLVVPIFVILCRLEEKIAHSSAILTILPLSLVSGIIYFCHGSFTVPQGLYVTAGVIVGGLIGTFAMKKFSNNLLRIIFYTLMIIAGVSMLISKL